MVTSSQWEREGRDAGAGMDRLGAVVVLGRDPVAAAWVALGLARAQASRRRVAVGDLVGELAPLVQLAPGDDPHGLADSFLYGVSLNRIARAVDEPGELFILPSGTEPTDDPEIYRHPRWRRLTAGFREVGALLVLVAREGVDGLVELIAATDGVILVGDETEAPVPARVLERIPTPPPRFGPPTPVAVRATEPGMPRGRTMPPLPELATPPAGQTPPGGAPPEPPRRAARGRGSATTLRQALPFVAAVIVLVAAGAIWAARRSRSAVPLPMPVPVDSSAARPDTLPRVDSLPPAPPPAAMAPVDPQDSASAAAWAVVIASLNTQSGAILKLQNAGSEFPAGTYAPVLLGADSARWFRVVTGAYPERGGADSLLAALRGKRVVDPDKGSVMRVPFALLVEGNVSAENAPALVSGYTARGLPVYALRQPDGTARLYAGAFETPEQAALLLDTLRAAGVPATVVYRTGRTL